MINTNARGKAALRNQVSCAVFGRPAVLMMVATVVVVCVIGLGDGCEAEGGRAMAEGDKH